MKPTTYLSLICSLAILTGAMPTVPNRAHRVPLQRRSRNERVRRSTESATEEQFSGTERVAALIHYTHTKYAHTFAAYEQNMGSRHPLDKLSRSSLIRPLKRASQGIVALTNQDVELWYGDLSIGTPAQDFTVDFDTGSSDLIMPDKLCEATCAGHRKYDSSLSSTSHAKYTPFLVVYGSGETSGVQYEDTVEVGGYQIVNQRFGGAEVLSPDFFYSNYKPDGLSGFAFQSISALRAPTVLDNLKGSGQLPEEVFSFKLSSTPGESELLVGATDSRAFNSDTLVDIPVEQVGYWQVKLGSLGRSNYQVQESVNAPAIVDSGTTLITGPEDIVLDYFSDVSGSSCNVDGVCTVPCSTIDSTVPTLTFGGKAFTVSPETWNLGPEQPGSSDCIAGLGVFSEASFMILGDVFLQNVYSIFNFSDPPRVSFAKLV